jgi:hypothetical protein
MWYNIGVRGREGTPLGSNGRWSPKLGTLLFPFCKSGRDGHEQEHAGWRTVCNARCVARRAILLNPQHQPKPSYKAKLGAFFGSVNRFYLDEGSSNFGIKFLKKFAKPLDKSVILWYNIYTKKEKEINKNESNTYGQLGRKGNSHCQGT